MDNKNNPNALSSFMKLLRKSSLSNVNEIVIVEDNARRRRSSISKLGNALKGGKGPHRRSIRKSQRWESQQEVKASSPAAPLSSQVSKELEQQEEPIKRRSSGILCPQRRASIERILCPQRRASIERRESFESQTSISSSASFLTLSERSSAGEQQQQPQLPAYELALQLISQKYAVQPGASAANNTSNNSITMELAPPTRRPSHGDICGVHRA